MCMEHGSSGLTSSFQDDSTASSSARSSSTLSYLSFVPVEWMLYVEGFADQFHSIGHSKGAQHPGNAFLDRYFCQVQFASDLTITETLTKQAINGTRYTDSFSIDTHEIHLCVRFFMASISPGPNKHASSLREGSRSSVHPTHATAHPCRRLHSLILLDIGHQGFGGQH
jgi:hypothetical protein